MKFFNKFFDRSSKALKNTEKQFKDFKLSFTQNWLSEIFNVDLIIIGTNWPEYKALKNNLPVIKDKNILLYDTKRLFSISEMNDVNYLTFGYYKNNG